MKDFDDLTEAELINLTTEDTIYYIDRACAEAGIPLLPPVKPELPVKPPENDLIVYNVSGIKLLDMQEAMRLREFLASLTSLGGDAYHYLNGYEHYFQEKTEPISIAPEPMMSEQRALAMKTAIAAHGVAQKQAEEERAEFDKIMERRETVSERVYHHIREAVNTSYLRRALLRDFDRYVELANGDRVVAARFLEKAKPDARTLLPDLFASFGSDDVAANQSASNELPPPW